jgi:hypothetical protein
MRVKNFCGVVNQFIIYTKNGDCFQSYDSPIVFISNSGKTYISDHWDYSVTTGKYRNRFLGETRKETIRKIDDGIYKLISVQEMRDML